MPDARKTPAKKSPRKAAAKKVATMRDESTARRPMARPLFDESIQERDFLPYNHHRTDPVDNQEPLPTPPWRDWNLPPFELRTQNDYFPPPPQSEEYKAFQAYVARYRNHPDFRKALTELRVPTSQRGTLPTRTAPSTSRMKGDTDFFWATIFEMSKQETETELEDKSESVDAPQPELIKKRGRLARVVTAARVAVKIIRG